MLDIWARLFKSKIKTEAHHLEARDSGSILPIIPDQSKLTSLFGLFPRVGREIRASITREIRENLQQVWGRPLPLGTRYFIGSLNNR